MESIFTLKDNNTHPSHVIYKGKCICGQTYIGETVHNLEVCVNEHSDVKVHMGSFNHCQFMVKKENKRSVLHSSLLSRTKQTCAITGPHLVPHRNRYYNWHCLNYKNTEHMQIISLTTDDDQTEQKRLVAFTLKFFNFYFHEKIISFEQDLCSLKCNLFQSPEIFSLQCNKFLNSSFLCTGV